jgi:hypothetical protein
MDWIHECYATHQSGFTILLQKETVVRDIEA